MKKLFTLFLALVASVGTLFAWTCERVHIGDLYYNLDQTTLTAEVTNKNEEHFEVDMGIITANIPNSIKYFGYEFLVTSIGERAFMSCSSLKSVTIGEMVTSIGASAFYGCTGLTSVTWDAWECSDFTEDNTPFYTLAYDELGFDLRKQITSVTFGDRVRHIPAYLCSGMTGITSITVPICVKSIGSGAFSGCTGLTSITIPNSITDIENETFLGCSSLTSVTIGKNVRFIELGAFAGCKGMKCITCKAVTPPICYNTSVNAWQVFNEVDKTIPLYVPASSVEAYKAAYAWNEFTNIQAFETIFYTVRFVDWDGTELKTEQVEQGESVTAPDDPFRDGYIFAGWDVDYSYVTSDLTITAQYVIKAPITVRLDPQSCSAWETVYLWAWTSDDILFDRWPGILLTADTAGWYSYTFVDEDIAPVNIIWNNGIDQTVDITNIITSSCYALDNTTGKLITASVVDCPKTNYIVTFIDWDETILKTEQVEQGQSATAPANPSREGYTFTGWDKEFSNVTSDLTVTAQYSINTYTVTFVDWDDAELKTEQVEYGKSATAPVDPTREGYTFIGWDTDFSNVQSDLTVTALYKQNDSSMTCAEAREAALAGSTYEVSVIGYVTEIIVAWDSTYKNISFWMADTKDGGRVFEGYRVKCATQAEAPNVGDKVKVSGTLKLFNSTTPEIAAGGTFEILERAAVETEPITVRLWASSAAAWSVVKLFYWGDGISGPEWSGIVLNKDADGWYSYTFDYSIKSVNIIWNDGTNQTVDINNVTASTCYKLNSTSGNKITVTTIDCDYTDPQDEVMTCAEAREAALAGSTEEVTVIGYVTEYVYLWSSSFKSVSFWMADTKDGGKVFEAYRAKCETAAEAPNVGDKVKIVGKLSVYNQSTPEISNGTFEILERVSADETGNTTVTATPTNEGSVVITWPEVTGATTYTIDIRKNGELICTLVFNNNGQLVSINFAAPARNRSRDIPQAAQAGKGWTYTVTGMEAGTTYTYSVTAKDDSDTKLFEQSVEFIMPAPQGIEDINDTTKVTKIFRNGQILILRGAKVYTTTGQEVK